MTPTLHAMPDPSRNAVDLVAHAMYLVVGTLTDGDPRLAEAEMASQAALHSAAAVLASVGVAYEADEDGMLVDADRWEEARDALTAAGMPVHMELDE